SSDLGTARHRIKLLAPRKRATRGMLARASDPASGALVDAKIADRIPRPGNRRARRVSAGRLHRLGLRRLDVGGAVVLVRPGVDVAVARLARRPPRAPRDPHDARAVVAAADRRDPVLPGPGVPAQRP